VGLAWSVCPQNNSLQIRSIYNTVVLVQWTSLVTAGMRAEEEGPMLELVSMSIGPDVRSVMLLNRRPP
jgi:hypothetical protein